MTNVYVCHHLFVGVLFCWALIILFWLMRIIARHVRDRGSVKLTALITVSSFSVGAIGSCVCLCASFFVKPATWNSNHGNIQMVCILLAGFFSTLSLSNTCMFWAELSCSHQRQSNIVTVRSWTLVLSCSLLYIFTSGLSYILTGKIHGTLLTSALFTLLLCPKFYVCSRQLSDSLNNSLQHAPSSIDVKPQPISSRRNAHYRIYCEPDDLVLTSAKINPSKDASCPKNHHSCLKSKRESDFSDVTSDSFHSSDQTGPSKHQLKMDTIKPSRNIMEESLEESLSSVQNSADGLILPVSISAVWEVGRRKNDHPQRNCLEIISERSDDGVVSNHSRRSSFLSSSNSLNQPPVDVIQVNQSRKEHAHAIRVMSCSRSITVSLILLLSMILFLCFEVWGCIQVPIHFPVFGMLICLIEIHVCIAEYVSNRRLFGFYRCFHTVLSCVPLRK